MNNDTLIILTTLGLHAAVIISPGPNFALISRLSLSGQRSSAFAGAFGFSIGAGLYAFLSMFGVGLLVLQVHWLANTIQLAGGIFLIYLGINSWVAAVSTASPEVVRESGSLWNGFTTGLLVELSNPKGIAFFLGLYAASVPPGTELWVKLTILAGGFCLENVWYGFVALLMASQVAQRSYKRCGAWIERSIGTLLAGFGLKILYDVAVK